MSHPDPAVSSARRHRAPASRVPPGAGVLPPRLGSAAAAALAVALAVALASPGCGDNAAAVCNGDERLVPTIFNGTLQPSFVPLTPSQVLAVGELPACSGTLIAPTWALTAAHCGLRAGASFCVGDDPDDPTSCAASVRVVDHPTLDLTLVELERDMREVAPAVIPIAVMTEPLDGSWVGQTAESAGYGVTETGTAGTRYFVAERVIGVTDDLLTVDGEGRHGVCFGDSGGPSLVIASDGSVRVAGALSFGDSTCVDVDNFTRADIALDWIESFTGPTVVEPVGCGGFSGVGRCINGRAVYCAGGDDLASDECAAGQTCGWDVAAAGFRCISGPDPCQGLDTFGACAGPDGQAATWCEDGVVKRRDCKACGELCEPVGGVGVYCAPDPCDGLDFQGRCNGDVAEWCEDGVFQSRDCGADGQSCGFIDETIGFYCRE